MIRALLLLALAAGEPWQMRELPAPVLACSLTASASCEGRAVTVTRASSAWCEGDDGQVDALGNNAGCFSSKGLLIEEARTNYWTNSLDASGWVNIGTPVITLGTWSGPFSTLLGGADGDTIQDDNAAASEGKAGPTTALGPGQYTVSAYFKQGGTCNELLLQMNVTGGTGSGSCTFSTINTTPTCSTGGGDRCAVRATPISGVYRADCTRTAGAGTTAIEPRIFPCDQDGPGDTGTVLVVGSQLEAGGFATSPIITAGAAVQRVNASATVPGTSIVRNSGHVSFVFTPEWSTGGGSVSNRVLFAMVDGAGINGAYFYTQPAGDNVVLRLIDNVGAGWSIVTARTWTANVPVLVAGRWTPPTGYLDIDGARASTAPVNVVRPTDHGGVIGLCNWPTGIDRCNGWIRNLEVRP